MRTDLSDVTLVVDRSGSMQACQEEAQNGINHFIKEQKDEAGDCTFSLVQFDTDYEFIHNGVSIDSVGEFALVPRGMTALLDAVGKSINETGERLSKIEEENRPGLVVFVIVTDGLENSSHEFTKQQIKEMIERQQSEYQWQFTFLGANQDAFAEAQGLGINKTSSANFTPTNAAVAFKGASANVGRMRGMSASGQHVNSSYTSEEREGMTGSSDTVRK